MLWVSYFFGQNWLRNSHWVVGCTKGQLILRCLLGVFTFFWKTKENKSKSSKVEIVRLFFGSNIGLKKSFQICLTFDRDSSPRDLYTLFCLQGAYCCTPRICFVVVVFLMVVLLTCRTQSLGYACVIYKARLAHNRPEQGNNSQKEKWVWHLLFQNINTGTFLQHQIIPLVEIQSNYNLYGPTYLK